MRRTVGLALAITLTTAVTLRADAQGGMAGSGGMRMGMPHDSVTMAQMSIAHDLVMNHDRIQRTVINLTNGVRTVTESSDPRIAALIRQHTIEMTARVTAGSDPNLPMESPAVKTIFRNRSLIRTRTDTSATGIIVEQTSTDSLTVIALQRHAAEVTDLVREGMAAMHRAMMSAMRGKGPQ